MKYSHILLRLSVHFTGRYRRPLRIGSEELVCAFERGREQALTVNIYAAASVSVLYSFAEVVFHRLIG